MLRVPVSYFTMNSTSLPTVASAPAPEADLPFDVRPIPCRVKHGLIFQRWLDLPVGGHFVLLNDHDPLPLRYQFEAEFPCALSWEYLERGPEDFRVKITKLRATPGATTIPAGCVPPPAAAAPVADRGVAEVDARGLEPPEPLIRILSALESLPAGATLWARTDREPCHLFGEATQRGFRHESKAQPDGSWLTVLTRA
jgi:uncharacterized protein (DUF2249 family)